MPETWSVQELLNAGWSEADLAWEGVAERTAEAASQKDYVRAKEEAGQALRIARADFESIDPRLGTSLANYGLCLSLSGDSQGVASLFHKGTRGVAPCGPMDSAHDRTAGRTQFALSHAHGSASP